MTRDPKHFPQAAVIALDDIPLQTAIGRATTNANHGRVAATGEIERLEDLRRQGRAARLRGLRDLPALLEQVEAGVIAAGGAVLWALDAAEANQHTLDICRRHGVRRGVKSKSMVTEEIELLPWLAQHGIEMIETDLGEYIVQISGDHPSHITMPVMHHTKEAIRDLLMRHAAMPYAETPEEMTAFARQTLRPEYLRADVGITGGNFLIAETGHVVTVTNEGNGRLTTTFPPVQIAIVGIEKVIPTWEDFLTLVQLLTRYATGQRLTVYINALLAGRRTGEADGAEHFYLILLDNGRSAIYGGEYAESLACIRCGSCLNVCPVYQSVGGHAYGAVYPGPIGSVISPLLLGKAEAEPLPFASSLCGACQAACPVDIHLPDMLLKLRRDLRAEQSAVWKAAMAGYGFTFGHPLLYRAAGAVSRRLGGASPVKALPYPFSGWTQQRDFPPFARQRFRDWWREERE